MERTQSKLLLNGRVLSAGDRVHERHGEHAPGASKRAAKVRLLASISRDNDCAARCQLLRPCVLSS